MIHFWQDISPFIAVVIGVSTAIYASGAIWLASGLRRIPAGQGETPLVSIVVAVRDEAENIEFLLDDLQGQTYPREAYEIIIVDDGSRDGTPDRVRLKMGDGAALKLLETKDIRGETGSKKMALTLGIEAARGEFILSTDGDCRVKKTWVRGLINCFDEDTGMVIGFSQIGERGQARGLRAGWEAVDFLGLMGCAFGSIGRNHAISASGQNLAYRKAAFAEVGGFERVKHRASGDDVLLLQLLRRLTRWRIVAAPPEVTATVHPFSPSWRALFNQRVRWASNALYLINKAPLFFFYMASAFTMDILLVLSPFLTITGTMSLLFAGVCWGGKIVAEGIMMWRSGLFFGRLDLLYSFPFWTLTQPLAIVLLGIGGSWGSFDWKGKKHRMGRRC